MQQSTIARRVACSGTGLHSGEEVEIALCPAPAGTGIVFVSLGAAGDGGDVDVQGDDIGIDFCTNTNFGIVDRGSRNDRATRFLRWRVP